MLRVALVVDAVLWLVAGAASVNRALHSDDDWKGPYALFSVLVMVAAAATTLSITMDTSKPNARSASRVAAVALAVVATVSTLVARAFVVWSVLLAAAFAALAGTGPPQRRHAMWLAAAFLAGLAVALVAAIAKLGPPGSDNDHSEARGWASPLPACSPPRSSPCSPDAARVDPLDSVEQLSRLLTSHVLPCRLGSADN